MQPLNKFFTSLILKIYTKVVGNCLHTWHIEKRKKCSLGERSNFLLKGKSILSPIVDSILEVSNQPTNSCFYFFGLPKNLVVIIGVGHLCVFGA
jgi:hypothetical protein